MASTSTLHEGRSSPKPERVIRELPAGCSIGPQLYETPRGIVSGFEDEAEASTSSKTSSIQPQHGTPGTPIKIIWVEFPPGSPDNPFSYSRKRKGAIMFCALFFAFCASLNGASYAPGIPSMRRDLGTTEVQAAAGISLYPWVSHRLSRRSPLTRFRDSLLVRWCWRRSLRSMGGTGHTLALRLSMGCCSSHMHCKLCGIGPAETLSAKNTATVLVGRFLMGLAGCIGSTVVAGTVSDMYPPEQ